MSECESCANLKPARTPTRRNLGTCIDLYPGKEMVIDKPTAEDTGCHAFKALPEAPAPVDSKDTNPKDALGATKLPLSLVPASAIALASVAHLNGALKYGAWNWRKAGVRASIYLDALRRHLSRWENGEEVDRADGVPHLAAALACLNIIVDARACGKLTDDRPPGVDMEPHFAELTPLVERLKALHAGINPKHLTIADTELKR